MPTALDTTLPPEILAIVTELGRDAVFSVDGSAYDPATGGRTASITTYTKKVTPPQGFRQELIDNDAIRADDLEIGLPAHQLEFTPARGQKVTIGDEAYRVVRVRRDDTGELVGIYWLQLR